MEEEDQRIDAFSWIHMSETLKAVLDWLDENNNNELVGDYSIMANWQVDIMLLVHLK